MKLYKLSQDINSGYDTYSDFVVCANDENSARNQHPSEYVTHQKDGMWYGTTVSGVEYETENDYPSWVLVSELDKVKVEYLGEADEKFKKQEIICASFHAG